MTTKINNLEPQVVWTNFEKICSFPHPSKHEEKIIEWKKKGLTIKFLPPYSPELNKIEILWRFIKHVWMPLTSYLSPAKFKENLFHILKNIGKIYKINFNY